MPSRVSLHKRGKWKEVRLRLRRRRQCDHRGRDRVTRHKPRKASRHQRLEEARNRFSLKPPKGLLPC